MDWQGALLHFWLLSISKPFQPVLQRRVLEYGLALLQPFLLQPNGAGEMRPVA